jgi:hypothetical protein
MRAIPLVLFVAVFLFTALVAFCAPAHAQGIERICIGINENGALNCPDFWASVNVASVSSPLTSIKLGAGKLSYVHCANTSATAYVQIFDTPSLGAVVLGATVPVLSVGVLSQTAGQFGPTDLGVGFKSGLAIAATTTPTGATAPAVPLDCNFLYN